MTSTHCSNFVRLSSTMYEGPCNFVIMQNSFKWVLTFFRNSIMLLDEVLGEHCINFKRLGNYDFECNFIKN